MFTTIDVPTSNRQELCLITEKIQKAISDSGITDGICILFSPHTTSALTIDSYLDPATALDLQDEIDRLVPTRVDFKHIFDTPSDASAHIKTSLIGNQLTLIIQDGKILLGDSQGIFFWEYDGPRSRRVHIKIIPS